MLSWLTAATDLLAQLPVVCQVILLLGVFCILI